MITIDELLEAVTEFQRKCHRAAMDHEWMAFATARAELKAWCEAKQLPIVFPDNAEERIERRATERRDGNKRDFALGPTPQRRL